MWEVVNAKVRHILDSLDVNPGRSRSCGLGIAPCPLPSRLQPRFSLYLTMCSPRGIWELWPGGLQRQPGKLPLLGHLLSQSCTDSACPHSQRDEWRKVRPVQAAGRSADAHVRARGFSAPGTCSCSFGGRSSPVLPPLRPASGRSCPCTFPSESKPHR